MPPVLDHIMAMLVTSNRPRLPLELLTEIILLAPRSSWGALCLTCRSFYDFTIAKLYWAVDLMCTNEKEILRAKQWCRIILEQQDKANLIQMIVLCLPDVK